MRLRQAVTEPREFLVCSWGRFACRVLGRHGATCRGIPSHYPRR